MQEFGGRFPSSRTIKDEGNLRLRLFHQSKFLLCVHTGLLNADVFSLEASIPLCWNDTNGIVFVCIHAAAKIALEVRINGEVALDNCARVTDCQPRPSTIRMVCQRSVYNLVVVN